MSVENGVSNFFCAYATLIHQAPGIFDSELVIFVFFNSVKCYKILIQYRETKHRNIFVHLLFLVHRGLLRCDGMQLFTGVDCRHVFVSWFCSAITDHTVQKTTCRTASLSTGRKKKTFKPETLGPEAPVRGFLEP